MSEEKTGVRALPPALLLAFAGWFGYVVARVIFMLTVKEPWSALRFNLASDGLGYMCEMLAAVGAFELARRLGGQAALGMRIVGFGFLAQLAVDVGFTAMGFISKLYEHEWVYKVSDYAYWSAWVVIPVGLAVACWRERRELAIAILVVSLLAYPPSALGKVMYGWMPKGSSGFVLDALLRAVRFAFLLAGFAAVARGTAIRDRVMAASGLRSAAKAMWLRLYAALVVPLLTLLAIGGKGGKGSVEMLKLAMFSAQVVNIVALALFALGALRAARAGLAELGRWAFVLGGAAAMWGAGVMAGQSTWLYKMLFGSDDLFGSEVAKYVQALAVAMPLAITAGMALLAVAISGYAARTGNEELRGHAQAKGAGFVTLTLVGLAITNWMLPDARSESGAIMLLLLAAGSMLVGLVMIARLFNLAADELDKDPGLPTASVVSDGT